MVTRTETADAGGVDVLAELLDGVRARGALFRCACVDGPWSLRFAGGAPLTLLTMVRGRGWLLPDGGEPVAVDEGTVAVVRGRAPYTVADEPGAAPRTLVTAAAYCPPPGAPAPHDDAPEPAAMLLSGVYEAPGSISDRLLRTLPDVFVVPGAQCGHPLLELLAQEVATARPGRRTVLDRLLDLMLLAALRAWFDRPGAQPPPWYRAWDHPTVGPALRLLHDDPARRWTVAGLAARTGVSRAALARHFTAEVGEPPMAYLASWRVDTAADLLLTTDDTVEAVARRVGYANAFALSVAFKRLRGIAPAAHRAAHRAHRDGTS
ncbi:AraC family transcriptional regulator [Streptomyces sp. NPDC048057]|uniref:AraC family transcriptional regulator n=1 Tax=Streptomyces sp. NPDC048057 TaxID=3155628 RepID=UPI0033CDF1F3